MPRSALVLWLGAIAAACALLPPGEAPGPASPDSFEVSARVAVRFGEKSATGRVQWRHVAAEDDMLITSPLGQGIARIRRRAEEFELVTADQQRYLASDAEALTEAVLGWRLPLAGLSDWLRARARSGSPARSLRDDRNRVVELDQDDWRIEYQDYEGERPTKLRLIRDGLEIRMVVDQWQAAR